MTKVEYAKCEKLMEEAIRNAERANKCFKLYESYDHYGDFIDASINLRNADLHKGCAEGINQALVTLGFKHERMKELCELL